MIKAKVQQEHLTVVIKIIDVELITIGHQR